MRILRIMALFFMFWTGSSSWADDGFVVSDGDTLHPVSSTIVSMKREDLKITYDSELDSWMVQVHFIFHNPRNKTISHLVAFENLSLAGTQYNNKVQAFTTSVNGKAVEFDRSEQEVTRDEEAPPLPGTQIKEYFSFKMEFPPGDTAVDHSYRYFGSKGWGPDRRGFFYILRTATRWKGPIGEFHLDIVLPRNSILIQEGKWAWLRPYGQFVQKANYVLFGKYPQKNGLFVLNGGLRIDESDFVPPSDLFLEFYDFVWYLAREQLIHDKPLTTSDVLFKDLSKSDLKGYTIPELRLLRNAIFAWHGYRFKDANLTRYFDQFIWYGANTWDPASMTKMQTRNVELLQSQTSNSSNRSGT